MKYTLILAAVLFLSACGQKGPLYLPGEDAPPASSSSTTPINQDNNL